MLAILLPTKTLVSLRFNYIIKVNPRQVGDDAPTVMPRKKATRMGGFLLFECFFEFFYLRFGRLIVGM